MTRITKRAPRTAEGLREEEAAGAGVAALRELQHRKQVVGVAAKRACVGGQAVLEAAQAMASQIMHHHRKACTHTGAERRVPEVARRRCAVAWWMRVSVGLFSHHTSK